METEELDLGLKDKPLIPNPFEVQKTPEELIKEEMDKKAETEESKKPKKEPEIIEPQGE